MLTYLEVCMILQDKSGEKSISKGGYSFVYAQHLKVTLQQINAMPQITFEEILQKYILLPKNWTVQMINKFELLNEQKEKKIQFRV